MLRDCKVIAIFDLAAVGHRAACTGTNGNPEIILAAEEIGSPEGVKVYKNKGVERYEQIHL